MTTQFSVWLALFPDSMSRAMQIGSNWTFTYALILWNHFVLFIIKFISNYVPFYIKTPAINSTNTDISNTTPALFLWNELIRTEFEYFPEKACLEKNPHFQLFINTMKPRPNGRHFADDSYLRCMAKFFFKCIFLKENFAFLFKFNWKLFSGSNAWYACIGWDNGLALIRQQATVWTNVGLVYWYIYALLSHKLMS